MAKKCIKALLGIKRRYYTYNIIHIIQNVLVIKKLGMKMRILCAGFLWMNRGFLRESLRKNTIYFMAGVPTYSRHLAWLRHWYIIAY